MVLLQALEVQLFPQFRTMAPQPEREVLISLQSRITVLQQEPVILIFLQSRIMARQQEEEDQLPLHRTMEIQPALQVAVEEDEARAQILQRYQILKSLLPALQ